MAYRCTEASGAGTAASGSDAGESEVLGMSDSGLRRLCSLALLLPRLSSTRRVGSARAFSIEVRMESTRGGSSSLDKGFTFSWTEIASATSAAELGEGEAALEDSCTGTFVQHEPMS